MFILTSLLLMIIGIIGYFITQSSISFNLFNTKKYNNKEIEWYKTHKDKWVLECPRIYNVNEDCFKVITEQTGWAERGVVYPRTKTGVLGTYWSQGEKTYMVGIVDKITGDLLLPKVALYEAEIEHVRKAEGEEVCKKWQNDVIQCSWKSLHYYK